MRQAIVVECGLHRQAYACTWCCMLCVQAGSLCSRERKRARARARVRACVRACAVPDLRLTRGASWYSRLRCQRQCAEPAQGAKRRRCAGEVCCGARVAA